MSLLFSEIKAESVDGKPLKLWESGHPDEYDLRELLQYEARYAAVKEVVQNGSVLHVRHYRFQVNGAEWLAERDHFALIDAYDELAQKYGAPEFTQRKDVKPQGGYQFRLKNAKTQQEQESRK